MPKQVLTLIDYFGPLAAMLVFAAAMLIFSFFIVNFYYISKKDDITIFEKFGAYHFNIALGPHSLADIFHGGPRAAGDIELDKEIELEKAKTSRYRQRRPNVVADSNSNAEAVKKERY